jgi:hypothetical protein
MKLPLIFALTLAVAANVPAQSAASPIPDYSKSTAAAIHRAFHQQGFKTDLSDFNFTVPKEMSDRGGALTMIGSPGPRPTTFLNNADLLTPTGDHAAVVVWKQQALAYPKGFKGYSYLYNSNVYQAEADKDVWPLERDVLADYAPQLDPAAAAALSGPFGFNLNAGNGRAMLLLHLGGLTQISQMFAGRTVMALHDHDSNRAWTNLLAATRVVTGWQMEPVEVSQDSRFGCLQTAYDVTWQALQAGDWPDARLAQLQREWESLDVFKPLPDTVAFMGASYVDLVLQQDEPSIVEDEKALMLFYHDRELEMRRVIESPSWAQMRLLPDMTNIFFLLPPQTNLPTRVRWQANMRRMPMEMSSGGVSLAGRAAEAEARRRIIITAIALERFRLAHGSYPKSLDALVPDWLKTPPIDFMNGKPLHYSLRGDGHFLLYSVGLDETDDGGKMAAESDDDDLMARMRGLQHNPDIVWPLPAPTAVADAHAAVQRGEQAAAEAEAARKAARKELLSNPKYKKTTWVHGEVQGGELFYKGQPLSTLLQNSSGANRLSLDALFTLKRVTTGKEPEMITFQLPIAYDRLTNMPDASLRLIMDSPPDDSFEGDPEAQYSERATNGETLLVWDSVFQRPGLRAIQALLMLPADVDHTLDVKGPVLPFSSTNLFWFDLYAGPFNETGANLYADLVERSATYRIEIKRDATKPPIKTFTGSTTNGIISLEWNLLDDHGNAFTNNSFQSSFTVTLTGSGRTQTLSQGQSKIGTRGD